MMKARIMKWIPASWKTTAAQQIAAENDCMIISKDLIREFNDVLEKEVITIENEMILQAIKDNKNIIIDNTNMNPKTLHKLKEFLNSNDIEYKVVDMADNFETPLEYLSTSLNRNLHREKDVPDSVIYWMYLREYDFPWGKEKTILCDIDWTIANLDHRLKYIKWDNRDWDKFFSYMSKDSVIEPIKELLNKLTHSYNIILLSWRPDSYSNKTIQRLDDNGIAYDGILMRNSYDKRQDFNVKRDIYRSFSQKNRDNILFVIDDRKIVKKMRVDEWVFVLDVNQHDIEF